MPDLCPHQFDTDAPGATRGLLSALVDAGYLVRQDAGPLLVAGGAIRPLDWEGLLHLHVAGSLRVTNAAGEPQGLPLHRLTRLLRDVATALEGCPGGIPAVASVVRGPAFRIQSGRLVQRPAGVDGVDRVLCLDHPISVPSVRPELLPRLWSGLLFPDPVYHANLLGFTLAMFARTACRQFPFLVLAGGGATGKAVGKSTVGSGLTLLLNGREEPPRKYSGREDELEMRIGAFAGRPGPNAIFFDNVLGTRGRWSAGHVIHSPTIAAATGFHSIAARRLYSDPVPVFDPILMFTMNGARVEADLSDRLLQIILTIPDGTTDRRIEPYPPSFIFDNRAQLLAEVVGVLDGLELARDTSTRMYDFEGVALAAARKLGFAPAFGGAAVVTCDAFIEELISLIPADGLYRNTMTHLYGEITTNTRLRELNFFVDSTHAGQNSIGRRLEERLGALTGRRIRTKEGLVSFTLEDDPTLNQRVLVMRKEPV